MALVGAYLSQVQAVSLQSKNQVMAKVPRTTTDLRPLSSLAQIQTQAQSAVMAMNRRAARRRRIKDLRMQK